MTPTSPTLHMLCGKIAAGKSTFAAQLADAPRTVLLSEDDWLHPRFGDQISTGADFVHASAKLRAVVGPHVADLLNAGLSVGLDYAANTLERREWMRGILEMTTADHVLHVLNPPDALCLERLHARNAKGEHPAQVSDAQFARFSAYFVLPDPKEGFTVKTYPVAR